MSSRTRLSAFLTFLTTGIGLANAVLRNVTVDDASTSDDIPYYFPSPANWIQGADCPGCGAHPDPSKAFGGTWHDSTFHPGDTSPRAIELSFKGSAVYVFFILANTIKSGSVDTVTNMNFFIDGVLVDNFVHNPSTSSDFIYNVPVYVNESFLLKEHQFRMEATGTRPVLILFDYLIYSIDDDVETTPTISPLTLTTSTSASTSTPRASETPTGSSKSNTDVETTPTISPLTLTTSTPRASETPKESSKSNIGAIIGGAVGGALALLLLSGAVLFWKRGPLLRSSDKNINADIVPSTTSSSGSNPRIEAQPTYVATPFSSKTRAINNNNNGSRPHTDTHSHSKSHKRSEMTGDPEMYGRSRVDLGSQASPPGPPASNLSISMLAPDSRRGFTDGTREIRDEVQRLRDEVARLRQQEESEEPPSYS